MSSPSSTRRTKDIFLAAHLIRDAEERARFLTQACGGDADLLQRVHALLIADASAEGFLELPVHPEPTAGDKVGYFGDYVLLDEIARGSSGVVFRARQVSLDRVVALKMLKDGPLLTSDADVHRLHSEAKAAASLDHPHILPIYEVGAHEGQPYFSMKLITGGTLQFRMAEYQQDVRKAVALLIKVARAMRHAHSQGILHRDLKPGNILLDTNDEPLIADFGLARKIGIDSSLTMTGQLMGTPLYMSPEQARGGSKELTPATDIYSLGTMLYELIEGRRPFQSDDLIELIRQVAEKPAPAPQSPHRALAAIAMKCLEKQPTARYGTAGALADDLQAWLDGRLNAPPRWSVPWRWVALAAACAALPFGFQAWWPESDLVVTTLVDELDPPGTAGNGLSLREAVRDAPEGGRIVFSQAGKLVLSGALSGIGLSRSVEIRGPGVEIEKPPEIDRTFSILGGAKVMLQGLTFRGQADSPYSRLGVGAIGNFGELTAIDCRFLKHGGSGLGGAIVCEGDITLRRCVFQGNFSNMMGGALNIRYDGAQRALIENCLFSDNFCYGNAGSAINISLQSPMAHARLVHCTVTGNIWDPDSKQDFVSEEVRKTTPSVMVGGALRAAGNVTVEHCIIAGNEARRAGEKDIYGNYFKLGPNFIGGDPKDAPAGLGASVK